MHRACAFFKMRPPDTVIRDICLKPDGSDSAEATDRVAIVRCSAFTSVRHALEIVPLSNKPTGSPKSWFFFLRR
ncbi:hypothetical protein GGE12_003547 [Rhizobium mongolense]|uniref:Uncharacterized protein n=1 Tax=Rhizobium mongolense TaxID=57676 RepID=A0A7W6RNI4_9HYPH|nr:hypothetical protein [Rhizobium mongolense]